MNVGNHLKSMPRVYIILKNKPDNFSPKLFRSAKNFHRSSRIPVYVGSTDHHWLERFRHECNQSTNKMAETASKFKMTIYYVSLQMII